MKFNCGLTFSDRKKLKEEYLSKWHPYFTIFPKRVGNYDCRFLETIMRKGTKVKSYRRTEYTSYTVKIWKWEYKSKNE